MLGRCADRLRIQRGCIKRNDTGNQAGRSQNRAARRDFHGRNAPCVDHQEPIAVSAAQHAGIFSKRGDDVVDSLVFAALTGLLVRHIQIFTADEPDTKHDACHVHSH